MSPVPPSSGRFPQPVPSTQQHYFRLSQRNAAAQDKFDVSGPFLCRHIPASGQLTIPGAKAGELVVIDERIWMPLSTGVKERAVLTNITSGQSYTVVYVRRWSDEIEVYAVRRAAT